MNALFRRNILGQPALVIDSKRCPMLRQACIDKYFYKAVKGTGAQYKDEPEKNRWSHVAEALGYACLGAGAGRPSALAGITPVGRRADDDFARACAARQPADMRAHLFKDAPERLVQRDDPRSWRP